MFKAIIENAKGERLQLFPNNNYAVSIDGLTPPKALLNFATVALNDGSIYNSARLENRNIVLTIKPIYDIENNRLALYRYFRVKKPCKFYFENGGRKVFIEGYVEAVDGSLFEQQQSIQVSIICPKPHFKAISETITDISQVVPLFRFPFAISEEGVAVSEIVRNTERNIINTGTAETGLIIELRAMGEVSNPIIYDAEGGKFELEIDMIEGDIVTINTNINEKAVTLFRDGVKTNIINKVKEKPTWFILQPGDNVFSYTASALILLQIVFKHHAKYEGV